MPRPRCLIRSITDFRSQYQRLRGGDAVLGVLALRPGEEIKVLDLAAGVAFFPGPGPLLSCLGGPGCVRGFMVPGLSGGLGLSDLAADGVFPEPGAVVVNGPGPSGPG
jgi:hypothetical protein